MEHFYNSIHGWFTFPILYKSMVDRVSSPAHFVEVGTWKGKSASYMAVEIIKSGKNIKFDCVDTWKGSEEHLSSYIKTVDDEENLYKEFLHNIAPVKHVITPVRMPSTEASKLYPNESLDFVFIDAGHDYQSVTDDLTNWYPKIKTGGIIAGHDYFSEWPEVVLAVNDFFLTKNKPLFANRDEVSWVHYKN